MEPRSRLLRTWELKGGVSAQVTAFELELPDGRTERLIARRHGAADLKRNPRIAVDEYRLLQLLEAAGVAAPRPRYLDAGGEIFSTPCLVVHYIDGHPAPTAAGEEEVVGQLATVLAEIHRVDRSRADFLRRWVDLQAALPDRRLDEPANERRMRNFLDSARPQPRRNPHVLLHGGFWPGNTLWKDGRLVGVIDWEDAAIGDPLADVANARLELLWVLGSGAMEEFTRRYESLAPAVDFTDLPYWDLWADLRLAGRVTEWGLDDATVRAMRAGHEAFVSQALKKLPAR